MSTPPKRYEENPILRSNVRSSMESAISTIRRSVSPTSSEGSNIGILRSAKGSFLIESGYCFAIEDGRLILINAESGIKIDPGNNPFYQKVCHNLETSDLLGLIIKISESIPIQSISESKDDWLKFLKSVNPFYEKWMDQLNIVSQCRDLRISHVITDAELSLITEAMTNNLLLEASRFFNHIDKVIQEQSLRIRPTRSAVAASSSNALPPLSERRPAETLVLETPILRSVTEKNHIRIVHYKIDPETKVATFIINNKRRTLSNREIEGKQQGDHVSAYISFLYMVMSSIPTLAKFRDLGIIVSQRLALAFSKEKNDLMSQRQEFLHKVALIRNDRKTMAKFSNDNEESISRDSIISSAEDKIVERLTMLKQNPTDMEPEELYVIENSDQIRRTILSKISDQKLRKTLEEVISTHQMRTSCEEVCEITNLALNMMNLDFLSSLGRIDSERSVHRGEGPSGKKLFLVECDNELSGLESSFTSSSSSNLDSSAESSPQTSSRRDQRLLRIVSRERLKLPEIKQLLPLEELSDRFCKLFDLKYENLVMELRSKYRVLPSALNRLVEQNTVGLILRHFRYMSILCLDTLSAILPENDKRESRAILLELANLFLNKTITNIRRETNLENPPLVRIIKTKKDDLVIQMAKILEEAVKLSREQKVLLNLSSQSDKTDIKKKTELKEISPRDLENNLIRNRRILAKIALGDEDSYDEIKIARLIEERAANAIAENKVRVIPASTEIDRNILKQEIENAFKTVQEIVIPIRLDDNQFVGLRIQKMEDLYKITYFDPMATKSEENHRAALRILAPTFSKFNCQTTAITNVLQHDHTNSGNNAAFVGLVLAKMANQEFTVEQGRLFFENADFGDLNDLESNSFGSGVRRIDRMLYLKTPPRSTSPKSKSSTSPTSENIGAAAASSSATSTSPSPDEEFFPVHIATHSSGSTTRATTPNIADMAAMGAAMAGSSAVEARDTSARQEKSATTLIKPRASRIPPPSQVPQSSKSQPVKQLSSSDKKPPQRKS